MSLKLAKPSGAKLLMRNGWQPMDPDAAAYITAVETADGQALEERVKIAIDNFVLGCKADGIWNAIKASCILAGARTTNGALIPLKGAAPTPVNFDLVNNTDYNRKTGLVGDSNTKYLNSNRAGNADPQNNFHMSCYNSTAHDPSTAATASAGGVSIGNGFTDVGSTQIGVQGGLIPADYKTFCRSRNATIDSLIGPARDLITFQGTSRSNASNYIARVGGSNFTLTRSSETPLSSNYFVFGRNNAGSLNLPSNARLAFYSIGEALNLALLDARVTDLVNAIGAAIP